MFVIEFLAAIEPASLPLLAVLAFSASLYPLGLMLGAPCSPCCNCSACQEGLLPDTVTVTLDGLPDTSQGPNLLGVVFQSCFGSGAAATVQAPNGEQAAGPIQSVTVTNGGSGYAKRARVQPTVTAVGAGGTGAEITVTLSQEQDLCGIPYWAVSALTIVDGGEGYSDGPIDFTIAAGDTEEVSATAVITTARTEPELTIVPPSGSGATFDVSLTQVTSDPAEWAIESVAVTNGGTGYRDRQVPTINAGTGGVESSPAYLEIRTVRAEPTLTLTGNADLDIVLNPRGGLPETWEIESVTVNDGGTGYIDGEYLTVRLGTNDVDNQPASLQVQTVRDEPTLSAVQQFSSTGTGAVLDITLTQNDRIWAVTEITVIDGGTGYTDGEFFSILPVLGQTVTFAEVSVNVTDGVITSVSVFYGGEYFRDTGVIEQINVLGPGIYYKDTGVINAVDVVYPGRYYRNLGVIDSTTLFGGGIYYREDPAGSPYVADITVILNQIFPSSGTGALLTAVVDDDPSSATFGQIVGVTVDAAGDGYLEWVTVNSSCCGEFYNGRSFVLRRRQPLLELPVGSCEYTHVFCGVGNSTTERGGLRVSYGGPGQPPTVTLLGDILGDSGGQGTVCDRVFTATANVANCSEFSFVAEDESGATATVAPGGEYDADAGYSGAGSCFICCKGDSELPEEVVASFAGQFTNAFDGDYVMTQLAAGADRGNQFFWFAVANNPLSPFDALLIRLRLCSSQTATGFQPRTLPSGDQCDECHNKCSTDAIVQYVSVFDPIGGFVVFKSSLESPPQPSCNDVCVETPLCGPSPGSYFVDGFGTLTIT